MLPTKKDLIERLRKHPLYKAALASVDKEQAARIQAMTEGFLANAADNLVPVVARVSDPKQLAEAQQAFKEDGSVVSLEPVSGSKDS